MSSVPTDAVSFPPPDDVRSVRPIAARARSQALLALAAIATTASGGLELDSVPVAQSLLALAASVVLVSGATDAVERITSASVPPYDVASERFDQSTFGGRYCRMLLACDPRLLLYTEDEARRCRALAYDGWERARETGAATDRDLWEARRVADSALRPATGRWVPRPFRMSGYLPANGPICVAMIASTSTLPMLFWSWMNQSQNAMVNLHNSAGPASDDGDGGDGALARSYAVAVSSALLVAFGLATFVRSSFPPDEATRLLRFISFPSAVIASSLNCYVVRSPEIEAGVPLLGDGMEDVLPGRTSRAAARRGVWSTTASRAVLQMPTYFVPPLILETVEPLRRHVEDNPEMAVPITTFLLLTSFGFGLPCAVGMFPQVSEIGTSEVEPEFAELGYEKLYYNRGL